MIKKKLSLVAAILIIPCIFFNCSSMLEQIFEGMAKKNCEVNANPRVTENRKITLFAKHHIFVGGKPIQLLINGKWTGQWTWNPADFTIGQFGYGWKNEGLVATRKKQINEWMPKVNEIFEKNGANISIFSNTSIDIIIDPKMFPADVGGNGPLGYTADVVTALLKKEPEYLHVIWLWQNKYKYIGVGLPYYVIICDDPLYGSEKADAKVLAHEFVHALGYKDHVYDQPSNLMNDGQLGAHLTKEQIAEIWSTLNKWPENLFSLTCDK